MRQVITFLLLKFCLTLNGQTPLPAQNLISVDHIPVVVKNPESIKRVLSDVLHFKIKEGKVHEGITNCFLKFRDGTYLEFLSPVDSSQEIGKYYARFLQNRQGGTSLAVSVTDAAALAKDFKKKLIHFEADSNKTWKTISPPGINVFFIEYSDKIWKDTKTNTAHLNSALSLQSTYIISDDPGADIIQYKSYGFKQLKNGTYLNIPFKHLVAGKSDIYFLTSSKATSLTRKFSTPNLKGICGFEIKVGSLNELNKLLPKSAAVIVTSNRITYFLKELNLFIDFTE